MEVSKECQEQTAKKKCALTIVSFFRPLKNLIHFNFKMIGTSINHEIIKNLILLKNHFVYIRLASTCSELNVNLMTHILVNEVPV